MTKAYADKYQQEIAFLNLWFDKQLPIERYRNTVLPRIAYQVNVISYNLFDIEVEIEIRLLRIDAPGMLTVICNELRVAIPEFANGYEIQYLINGKSYVHNQDREYFITNSIITEIDNFLHTTSWDYVQFSGSIESDNKLYNTIAQRLTCLQPGVERFVYKSNLFVITRF